jgi:hypothetical protein
MLFLATAAPVKAAHVIIDSAPSDPTAHATLILGIMAIGIALITLLAVLRQIWLAKETLKATNADLDLTQAQLKETQQASEQTRQALALTQQQVEMSRQEAIAVVRRTAPRVVGEVRETESGGIPFRALYVSNKGGGIANYVTVSGMTPHYQNASYKMVSAAEHIIQVLAVNETRSVFELSFPPGSYAQYVRIRYLDVFGNKYITEYRSINEGLQFPIFREPWLGKEYGFQRPGKWSGEVTWEVEHYERYEGFVDEPVEKPGPVDTNAPREAEEPNDLELYVSGAAEDGDRTPPGMP